MGQPHDLSQPGLGARLFRAVTGRPWVTVRSMRDEFGPPPAEHFAGELAGLGDDELLAGPQRRAPRRSSRRTALAR
ncbi:hypothetical protein Voc01_011510 [Virgisporangium ochraceum]|uniref:Uncharacterized protein n=1 Tax=Virgisporangium ochraceum TaxID=65505 RepID=A0A8J4E9A4_9ACTN|nr:hypothetical protein Voc01_011510 [Virgisporangium ochraceum]